ncbi:efflux RND transporter periplasmic adaptor subunit [Marinobacter caseinilyticus]|uniref:efflux RND transporter periplasmic adaptor subunit n=1 Tax=Marinobacter caseinilyticus TaxID=2692195 RepID=UPI001409B3AB|nr:efflux RND transporter periplasmic adaptor subunit [Marinobacter caseinilyticus]
MTTLKQSSLLVLGVVLALGLSGCSPSESAPMPVQSPVTVRAASVVMGDQVAEPLRFSGIVQAQQRATLTFQVSGTLTEREVELGARVEAGQVLAKLYNPGLEPAKASAKARLAELGTQLDQAQREWERASSLRKKGVVSEQALEQLAARRDGLRASVATAQASLAQASQMLQESVLKAPFAGRVEALLVERDEFVTAGRPVLRLSSPEGREVEVRVPAFLLSQVALTQSLPVWSVQYHQGEAVMGTVNEIAQASAIRGELHPVLVGLPDDTLEPGEPVEVGIVPRIRGQLSVPVLAIMRATGGNSVFRVSGQTVEQVPVTVHRIVGERVVVSSDHLGQGDQVVYAGLTRLADGDPVELLP